MDTIKFTQRARTFTFIPLGQPTPGGHHYFANAEAPLDVWLMDLEGHEAFRIAPTSQRPVLIELGRTNCFIVNWPIVSADGNEYRTCGDSIADLRMLLQQGFIDPGQVEFHYNIAADVEFIAALQAAKRLFD